MLVDDGLEHSFITQECKDTFVEVVAAACERCLEGSAGEFEWYEEWELTRTDDGSVLAVSEMGHFSNRTL